ncbi:INCENP family protein [Abortiporus biennis]
MDGSLPGGEGVLAWCNSIRFAIAQDPGREFLDTQIQKQGFDFIENYLQDVLFRPRAEPVYELLKTPGRKKDVPKRTRAATAAAAAKAKVILDAAESTEDFYAANEKVTPINEFQKALMEAKDDDDTTRSFPQISPPATVQPTKSLPKVVTIADTPEVSRIQVRMDVDDVRSAEKTLPSSPPLPAEDISMELEEEPHIDENTESLPTKSEPEPEPQKDLSVIAEDDEDGHNWLPEVSVHPSTTLPVAHSDTDMTVPLREEPSTTTNLGRIPGPSPLRKSIRLQREPSSSSLFNQTLAHTPGTGLGGGKRTSWLTKAKEAKALEMTGSGKRGNTSTETHSNITSSAYPLGSGGHKRKSGDMLGVGVSNLHSESSHISEDDGRKQKLPKLNETSSETPNNSSKITSPIEPDSPFALDAFHAATDNTTMHSIHSKYSDEYTVPLSDVDSEEKALDRIKKTVEGFGAKTTKSLGKSLGGNVAAALAEARAAAEARVAQRNKEDGVEIVEETSAHASSRHPTNSQSPPATTGAFDRRLSVSDLVTTFEKGANSGNKPKDSQAEADNPNVSISTTPPNSPPPASKNKGTSKPSLPVPSLVPAPPPQVFSKPPTVFVAPPRTSSHTTAPAPAPSAGTSNGREFSFKLPVTNPFTLPAAMSLGLPASLPSSSNQGQKQPAPLSAQTSKNSVFSDIIFDKEDSAPAWMPSTQDTDYSIPISQSRPQHLDDLDEDDSWHVDEKLKGNQMWTPFGLASSKDDTMTWSTLPSQSTSQKGGDTGLLQTTQNFTDSLQEAAREHQENIKSGHEDEASEELHADDEEDLEVDMDIDDDDDLRSIAAAGKSTLSLVDSKQDAAARSGSQLSMASTSSSGTSQLGFFGQASKLVSSVLGGGKKAKPEPPKSIQRAAAVAKKQQEEADRKAARLREMENRRQLAIQRKAEEEKTRAQEEERKMKEEAERRKREREEHTDKRPLRSNTTKKTTDDDTKKRKIITEAEKKAEAKKPPSRDNQPSRLGKPASSAAKTNVKSSTKQLAAAPGPSSQPKEQDIPAKSVKPTPSSSNLKKVGSVKGKVKATSPETSTQQPAQDMQTQNAGRSTVQQPAAVPRDPPPVASESIELPDINSEYSDSDDEDRPRTFDPPEWAQSPNLGAALQQQSTMNPDDIFGRIGPLRMEEIFRTRQSRFRARTSSANWTGTDQLTAEEEREYARRMGFRS